VYRFFLSIVLIFTLIGCGPKLIKYDPKEPQSLGRIESYTLELENLKIDKPIPIFLTRDGQLIDAKNAEIIGYLIKEHNKITAKILQGNEYRKIIDLLVKKINVQIEIINSTREFVELEQVQKEAYRKLWIDSQNMVITLEHQRKWDDIIHKATTILMAIGMIAIGVL